MTEPLTTTAASAGGGAPPEQTWPATPLQESLWRIHHRAPDRSVYSLTWRLEIEGELDRSALEHAWQAVVDRHEGLRIGLRQHGSGVEQFVVERAVVTVPEVAWDATDAQESQEWLDDVAQELHSLVFRLDRPPLARLVVVRAGHRYELHACVHHSVIDGWAFQLVMAELSHAYGQALRGEPVTFESESVPATEYTRSLLESRDSPRREASRNYWRERLAGGAGVALGSDPECEITPGVPGGVLLYDLSAQANRGLDALAEAAEATPFLGVLAAMFATLSAGGAGNDLTMGVVVANRMTMRAQAIVGYLANLVLIRTEIEPGDTLVALTSRVRDTLWESLPHQHLQFPEVSLALDDETRAAYGDAPPILITDHGHVGQELHLGDVRANLRPSPSRTTRGLLQIGLSGTSAGRRIELEYDSVRYTREDVVTFLSDVERLLAAVEESRDLVIGDLEVRSRATRAAPTDVGTRAVVRAPARAEAAAVAVSAGGASVQEQVERVWEQVLGAPPGAGSDDFFAQGGNSLLVVQLVDLVDQALGVQLDVASWLAQPTLEGIVHSVRGGADPSEDVTGPIVLQDGPGLHLHLVPGAGGSPHDYHALVRALPPDWHVTTVRDTGEESSATELAARWRADLDAYGRAVDAYGGWSIGGLLAYEMLRAAGGEASGPALVLLDTVPRGVLPDDPEILLGAYVDGVYVGAGLGETAPRIKAGEDGADAVLAVTAALLRRAGVALSAEALQERWRRYLLHCRAVHRYEATEPLRARSVLVAAAVTGEHVARWRELLGCEVVEIDTDHYALLRPPAIERVAAAVERALTPVSRP
jgi:thioesterase domain-containing protein